MTFVKKIVVSIAIVGGVKLISLFILPSKNSFAADFAPPAPVTVSSRIPNSLSNTDYFNSINSEVDKFLKRRNIVGASLSIARDGKLVMAKGYGLSNKESNFIVEPYNLFRVASVSKLITAVGIMKLCEENKLSLDDKVFGLGGILNDPKYLNYADKRVENITVYHLLNHSAGWNNRYGDPSFMHHYIASQMNLKLPICDDDIISFMMTKRMHFNPGASSAYSNFGYQVLGKIIEKCSGKPYEEYIRTSVLFPIGIFDMKLGHSYLEERDELEVCYYEAGARDLVPDYQDPNKMVPRFYGGNDIHTLGAAGGWIASSTDLLKLLLAIDGNDYPMDILSKETVAKMTTPILPNFSPLGWRGVKPDGSSWYRTGTLAGTSAMMERMSNGLSYVFIVNTSTYKGPDLAYELQRVVNRGLAGMKDWPSVDLFELEKGFETPIKMIDFESDEEGFYSLSE